MPPLGMLGLPKGGAVILAAGTGWRKLPCEVVAGAPVSAFTSSVGGLLETMGHWINYYNLQRPNQGIDNSTPAERFFKFSHVAREEIERCIRKNEKDLAFGDPPTTKIIGQGAIGVQPVEVRKEGSESIVLLNDREVPQATLEAPVRKLGGIA
jgi:hypothetical protein